MIAMRNLSAYNIQNTACFLFFALFLSVGDGYNFAGLIASLAAFFIIYKEAKIVVDKRFFYILVFFLVSLFLWGYSFDNFFDGESYSIDNLLKYLLAGIVLLALALKPISINYYISGCVVGCMTACAVAIYQFPLIGRAAGFTNAIRFGNIALWLGLACLFFAIFMKISIVQRAILLLATLCGVMASILSLSRGGWLIFLMLPLIFFLVEENNKKKIFIFFSSCVCVFVIALAAINIPFIQQRVQVSTSEVTGYFANQPGAAETSVGARLEQWSLAWKMGQDHLWIGWGDQGYEKGREIYVNQGEAAPSVVNFGHAHNDYLNIFAKRGILGVVALTLIYLLPFFALKPDFSKKIKMTSEDWRTYKAITAIGMSIPISYFVFGWTEFFFYLNIGHIFYILSISYTYSAIKYIEVKCGG